MSDQRHNIISAIDALRVDAIADLADLAASYWLSIGEARRKAHLRSVLPAGGRSRARGLRRGWFFGFSPTSDDR